MYEWKKTSRSLQHIQSLLLHTGPPFPLKTQCPKSCLRFIRVSVCTLFWRNFFRPENDVHKNTPPPFTSSRSVEVKLGEMALTSKLEHLKAHGPLSHYRSFAIVYISWREVFGRIFFKWERSGSKITKTWNCLGRSQRKWELIAKTIKDEQEGQPKLRKIEKKWEIIWFWVCWHIFATFWFSRENGCSL